MPSVRSLRKITLGIGAACTLVSCGGLQTHNRPPEEFMASHRIYVDGIHKVPTNSPVKIVGGSIKFRSIQGWTPSGQGYYTPISDAGQIEFERVRFRLAKGKPADFNLPEVDGPWKIAVNGRDDTGMKASGNGIYVYTKDSAAPTCDGTPSAPAKSICISPQNANSGFHGADLPGESCPSPAAPDACYSGQRYQDKSAKNADSLTENIWSLTMTFRSGAGDTTVTFFCPDSDCRVNIGPKQ